MLQIEDRFDEFFSNCIDAMDGIVELEYVGAGKRQSFTKLTLLRFFKSH